MTWRSLVAEPNVAFVFASGGRHAQNGAAWGGDFVLKIRAELPAPVEKSGWQGHRTNVVYKMTQSANRGASPAKYFVGRVNHIAPHTSLRSVSGRGARLRRSPVSTFSNWLLQQAFPDHGRCGAAVDSLGAKTLEFRLGRMPAAPKKTFSPPSRSTMEIK